MIRAFSMLPVLLVVALSACSSKPYRTDFDFDREAAFADYRTWAWISDRPLILGEGAETVNPLLEQRLMAMTRDVLERKGFRQVDDPELADITLAFTIGKRDRISVQSYPTSYHATYGYWGRGWGYGYRASWPQEEVRVREYTEGQLAIDIFDREAHRPVWHGFATGNIKESWDREKREAVLREAVEDILATFPPA